MTAQRKKMNKKKKTYCENVAIAKRLPACCWLGQHNLRTANKWLLLVCVCVSVCVCDCGYFLQLQLVVMQSQITNRARLRLA